MFSRLSKASIGAGFLLSTLAIPVSAGDQTGFYGILSVGSTNPSDQGYDIMDTSNNSFGGKAQIGNSTSYELGLGYDWGRYRTDVTYSNSSHNLSGCSETRTSATCVKGAGDTELTSVMGNVYRDFSLSNKFTPFVGAGIGATNVSPQNIKPNGVEYNPRDQYGFTYQFKGGVNYDLTNKLDLVGEVAFRNTTDIDTRTDVSKSNLKLSDISSTTFQLGLRYNF